MGTRSFAIAAMMILTASGLAQGQWVVQQATSKMDDSRAVTIGVKADSDISGWLSTARPVLYVRCQEGKLDVIVYTGMSAQPNGLYDRMVRYRIDADGPVSEDWSESTASDALFASEPRRLLAEMRMARRFRFEFTPFHSDRVIADFKIAGLDAVAGKVESACPVPGEAPKTFYDFQVDKQARLTSAMFDLPECVGTARTAEFIVDTYGSVDLSSFKPGTAADSTFVERLKGLRFSPALVKGEPVRQKVEMPICR